MYIVTISFNVKLLKIIKKILKNERKSKYRVATN